MRAAQNGRETGVETNLPPLPQPFIHRHLRALREEGRDFFEIIEYVRLLHQGIAFTSSRARICLIKYSRPVRLMQTISPTASDWQSVTIELAVRRDGLNILRHHSPPPCDEKTKNHLPSSHFSNVISIFLSISLSLIALCIT